MTDVRETALQRLTLYAVVLVGLYLACLVLSPFLAALTWSVMLAILFHGVQERLAGRIGRGAAAAATTVLVAVVIVAPALLLVSTLAHEAPQIADYLKQSSRSAPPAIQRIWDVVRSRSPFPMAADPTDSIQEWTRRALAVLAPQAGAFVVGSASALGTLAATLFALFFMLRDGEAMSAGLRDRLPFSDHDNERLMRETRDLVTAGVGAGVMVAAAQGVVGGLAFWTLGIGMPVLWGVVIAFCSLLPAGAAIVWLPVGLALLVSGDVARGVEMLLVGTFGISMVDNVLRPLLLSGRTSVGGFVVFFGLLGGAAAFGLIGLVIGPIILVMTWRVLEILRVSYQPGEPSPPGDQPLT